MSNFSFQTVDKMKFGSNTAWNHDAIRVNRKYMTLGSEPAKRLGNRQLRVEKDPYNKAFRISVDTNNGFKFQEDELGRLSTNNKRITEHMPLGDYRHIGDNVFVMQ